MVNSVQYMSASNPSRSFYLFSYPIYHSFTDSVTADQSINRSVREKEMFDLAEHNQVLVFVGGEVCNKALAL